MRRYRVFLGLGSNIGERYRMLQLAAGALGVLQGTRLVQASPVYETDPFGKTDQERFLNAVLEVETTLPPAALVTEVKAIERRLGRQERGRWGPREIDIDILLYDGLAYQDAEVSVPHPGLAERRFVLVPLREIAPDLVHPVSGLTMEELAGQCGDTGRVVQTSYRIRL